MARTKRASSTVVALGTLVLTLAGCAAAQPVAAPEGGAAGPDPKSFFLTSLAPSNQYVIDGPAVISYVEPKGSFFIGRNTPAGPQYVGPLSGPLTSPIFVPDGYFLTPQNPEGAIYSGQCVKPQSCFRFAGAAQPAR